MKELKFMNNDIPNEVLLRLSTQDLYRLKFVSKEWDSLISDPSFIRFHLKKKETVSGFFFQERYQWCDDDISRISYIPVDSKRFTVHSSVLNFLPESVVILNSCNGLLCCRSCLPTSDPLIYICNPLSKEWTSVNWDNPSKRPFVSFAFYNSSSPFNDGTAYFKIVAVSETEIQAESDSEECKLVFDIYSSAMKTWSRSKEICRCADDLVRNKSVSVDSNLYWLTSGNEILMFDPLLELSCLVPLPLPASVLHKSTASCIGESQGKLHYVVLSEDGLQLWVLNEPFSLVWDPRQSTPLDKLERENPLLLPNFSEIFASHVSNDLASWIDLLAFKDEILFIRVSTSVYFYYFETGKLKSLCTISELGPISFSPPTVVPYTMSFVPLTH